MTNPAEYHSTDAIMELEQISELDNLSDTEVLQHTRRVKLKLVDALTSNGIVPTDPKEVNALMKVLDSIDKTAHGNIRNSIDQDNSAALGDALSIIAAVQQQVGNTDPYMRDLPVDGEIREVTIDTKLVDVDFVPGELSQELQDLQYDSFIDKFEAGGD